MKILILLILAMVFFSGCVLQNQTAEEYDESELNDITEEEENPSAEFLQNLALAQCEVLCNNVLGTDLSNGPCLSDNNVDWDVENWVCDIAHSPRQDIDNIAENQCLEYRKGLAHHFVELDTECNLISFA